MNAVVPIHADRQERAVDNYRVSTDAAGACKEIVVATASTIQGRKFVSVEGWQAIAIAHGCAAGARDVEKVDGGVRAIGEIRRMSDGAIISTAEGFVGEDESTWYGGKSQYGKVLPKRADYAIRAMAQTRAISRACRSAFAHVVVMMNAGLQTTPAEEVPEGGFDNDQPREARQEPRQVAHPVAAAVINDDQRNVLLTLATQAGVDARALCEQAGVDAIVKIPADVFDVACKWLERRIQKKAPGQKTAPQSQQTSDILEDSIPY